MFFVPTILRASFFLVLGGLGPLGGSRFLASGFGPFVDIMSLGIFLLRPRLKRSEARV